MAQNKKLKKIDNFAKAYAMTTQGIISIPLLLFIGLFIGLKINKDSALPVILALIGSIAGIIIFIMNLIYVAKLKDKEVVNDGESKG